MNKKLHAIGLLFNEYFTISYGGGTTWLNVGRTYPSVVFSDLVPGDNELLLERILIETKIKMENNE